MSLVKVLDEDSTSLSLKDRSIRTCDISDLKSSDGDKSMAMNSVRKVSRRVVVIPARGLKRSGRVQGKSGAATGLIARAKPCTNIC
jgi:hypothetical protein